MKDKLKFLLDKLRFFKNDYVNHFVIAAVLYITTRLLTNVLFGDGADFYALAIIAFSCLVLEFLQGILKFGEPDYRDYLAGFAGAITAFVTERGITYFLS